MAAGPTHLRALPGLGGGPASAVDRPRGSCLPRAAAGEAFQGVFTLPTSHVWGRVALYRGAAHPWGGGSKGRDDLRPEASWE